MLDPSGVILPGAHSQRQTTREAVTDRDGRFLFDDVKPATGYALKAELAGFITDEARDLVVGNRQTVTVELSMDIGCVGDLVVPLSGLDLLLSAKGLAHVRMTGDTVDRRDGCGPKRTAVVLGITLFSPIGPRSGDRILLMDAGRFEPGKEYFLSLSKPYNRKEPHFAALLAREVVAGRIRGPNTDNLGIRAGMTLEQAVQHLVETRESASRHRPYDRCSSVGR